MNINVSTCCKHLQTNIVSVFNFMQYNCFEDINKDRVILSGKLHIFQNYTRKSLEAYLMNFEKTHLSPNRLLPPLGAFVKPIFIRCFIGILMVLASQFSTL